MTNFSKMTAAALLAAGLALGAERVALPNLLEMAGSQADSATFRDTAIATLGEKEVRTGTAAAGHGPDFIWVTESTAEPTLFVDDQRVGALKRSTGSNLWYLTAKLKTGTSHSFYYEVEGKRMGGRNDVAAYLPECYEIPGVPQGTLSDKLTHTSKIYEGMTTEYWIYVPAQYDPKTPAALMVWHDGQGHINRNSGTRTLNVVDNLIHQKKIPVMIQVFISPGQVGEKRMRSILYDTVDDTHPRFLRDELLPEVYAKYNVRKDGYSRAVAGNSSGGISAFNIAWQQTDQFNRVLSHIGSFTSIQWKPAAKEGGETFPFRIRKEPRRNIRVWLQDGSEDLENNHGSWPLQNLQFANSLKMRGYDFHLSWGNGSHSGSHGNAESPVSLAWLWRDYDPAKTEQVYEPDPAEKDKPYFRVKSLNR